MNTEGIAVTETSGRATDVTTHYDKRGNRGIQSIPEFLTGPYRFYESLLIKVLAENKPSTFLDFCCGCGVHTLFAAKHGLSVTGVDLSPASIQTSQKAVEAINLPARCQFIVGDALSALRRLGAFDVVFCSGSLYYFQLDEVLPLLKSSLKNGGNFFCVETNGSNFLMNVWRSVRQGLKSDRDERTMKALLKAQDFDRVIHSFKKGTVYYFDFLTLGGVFLKAIPAVQSLYLRFVRPIDFVLLNRFKLKVLAFKVVIHCSE